jgi:hypothetical protein
LLVAKGFAAFSLPKASNISLEVPNLLYDDLELPQGSYPG